MRAVVVASLVIAGSAAGPQAAPQSGGPADSTRAAYRERLVALRDTVHAVGGAIVVLRRDLRSAGSETVLSKAGALTRACRSVRSALLDGLPAFAPREVPPSARPAADSLRTSIRDLAHQLEVNCEVGLNPKGPGLAADSIRAWGPYRTAELGRGIQRFQMRVALFAGAVRFKLPQPGR